jgi:hypothetical protein
MKKLLFIASLMTTVSSFADSPMLVAVQGKARAVGTLEVLIEGKAVSADKAVGIERANDFSTSGFAAFLPAELNISDANCSDGVYVVTAGKGNFLPNDNRNHIYFMPKVVSFNCINK